MPKAAQAILALPHVESLHLEVDGRQRLWVCHLAHGFTTDALGGGGTIINGNLRIIRDYVKGAYAVPPVAPAPAPATRPVLPGESTPPEPPMRSSEPVLPSLPTTSSRQFHTIKTDDKHRVTVRQILDAVDAWAKCNLRTEHGLAINGQEIYWLDYAEGQGHHVPAHAGPLLRMGVRHGSNEGWILVAYVEGRITPILSAKLWTLDAATQLMAALARASADCVC